MSAATTEDTMIFAELWLSFGSLVRAYAAAASVHAGHAADVVVTEQTVSIAAGPARLDMACNSETGVGAWQLTSFETALRQGRLQLLPEGRIALDSKTLELDHAAIDLVASVMRAAKHSAKGAR